jgi:hypothetical protein
MTFLRLCCHGVLPVGVACKTIASSRGDSGERLISSFSDRAPTIATAVREACALRVLSFPSLECTGDINRATVATRKEGPPSQRPQEACPQGTGGLPPGRRRDLARWPCSSYLFHHEHRGRPLAASHPGRPLWSATSAPHHRVLRGVRRQGRPGSGKAGGRKDARASGAATTRLRDR